MLENHVFDSHFDNSYPLLYGLVQAADDFALQSTRFVGKSLLVPVYRSILLVSPSVNTAGNIQVPSPGGMSMLLMYREFEQCISNHLETCQHSHTWKDFQL